MNPRELAVRLAVISVIADRAKELKDELRAQIMESLDQAGADSAAAILPSGVKVAKVGVVSPSARVKVINDRAFTDHVAQEYPTEVVTTVREGFSRHYLETLQPTDDGQAVDPNTGAIVPGVSFIEATPYASIRFEKTGRQDVVDAVQAGIIPLDVVTGIDLPRLEA